MGRSVSQSNGQTVSQPVGLSVGWLIGQSVSHPVPRSFGRWVRQPVSAKKNVVLASKFRFFEFLLLKTCRLKACACTCADSGSAAIEIDSARKPLWHVFVYTSSRRIFVYTFCLINMCLSQSDDANKIKTLNIEILTVSVIPENLSPKHRMVSEKFSSENSKFYRECMAH